MLKYGRARLERLLAKHSGGKLGGAKTEELILAARGSFGISYATDAISLQIKQTAQCISFLSGLVDELDTQIVSCLEETGTYLDTIPGIGPVYASIIVAEIGDISRFSEAPQIIAYAGMDVPANQSGEFTGSKKHMSKRGSPALRWALLEGANSVRAHDPYFRDYYDGLIARGKHHYVALAAVARKLVNVIFTLLKEQRAYQAKPPGTPRQEPA
jgi:transposase